MTKLYPVILCGGSGTRLWPLSRQSYPKQFARLLGSETLFQQAVGRFATPPFRPPVVVTASAFRFIVTEQLAELGSDATDILIEPAPRNTAPAILAAALRIEARDPGATILVAPSDHFIPDAGSFRSAVLSGLPALDAGRFVTFGIRPERPETGYGYVELAGEPGPGPSRVARFVEKPDAATAQRMISSGRFLWNAGIFLMRARDLIAAFQTRAPDMLEPVAAAVAEARPDLGFVRLAEGPWDALRGESIDYAIMEHAENLSVVAYDGGWSDLGAWDSVLANATRDDKGVALHGPALALDCANTLLRAESEGQRLVGLGLRDIVAVAMPDAVLVARLDAGQRVKDVVARLKAEGASQAEAFPRDHRPWGWFDTLAHGARFLVKRIHVHPGAALSLQSHVHRAEHWVVVEGTARATIGEEVRAVAENQSVYVPPGTVHRLENPGTGPLVLIEVQTGSHLSEDDILRYEDAYGRR